MGGEAPEVRMREREVVQMEIKGIKSQGWKRIEEKERIREWQKSVVSRS